VLREFRPACVLFLLLTCVTGIAYPLAVTGVARVIFPRQAGGSLIEVDGRVVGSELVGQAFTGERYFHGRPSATSPVPYDGMGGAGSNLGPTNPSLAVAVGARIAAVRAETRDPSRLVPVDLVTASGSGLDPHVSPAAALLQVPRIARARGLDEREVRTLVERHVEHPTLGVLGAPRVNVLRLNLELDSQRR
jgi:potassium-transporting ATPase KdpC subunit